MRGVRQELFCSGSSGRKEETKEIDTLPKHAIILLDLNRRNLQGSQARTTDPERVIIATVNARSVIHKSPLPLSGPRPTLCGLLTYLSERF